jgi:capsular polysaccharide biosynthesis protein
MELKGYWAIIRKRLWLILLLMIVSGVPTGIYSYTMTEPLYTASSKIIVNQNENQSLAVQNGRLDIGMINSDIQLIKTYKEIIMTPRIMNVVVEQYPQLQLTANELIHKIGVSSVNDTQVMSIYSIDSSYSRAANIVNAVSAVFQNEIPKLMKIDNVSILNAADPEANAAPIATNAKFNIMVSLVLSFMLGLGLAFLLDYLDDTVRTEGDVAGITGFPVIATVPRVNTKRKNKNKRDNNTSLRRGTDVTLNA